MTQEEIKKETEEINRLSNAEMAELWRFAPAGHKYFNI